MSAFAERRIQDVEKLKLLSEASRKKILVTRVAGSPPSEIDIELYLKTAPSRNYPSAVQDVTKLTISLPARYPLVEPIVSIKTPIFHPNVYSSGKVCLGMKWLPSFGLDLLVNRLGQIVVFDAIILNEQSPANRDALTWYQSAKRNHAKSFPTDTLPNTLSQPKGNMRWTDAPSSGAAKTVVTCPSCGSKLSLPAGKKGTVKCPRCANSFEAIT